MMPPKNVHGKVVVYDGESLIEVNSQKSLLFDRKGQVVMEIVPIDGAITFLFTPLVRPS